MKVTKGIDRTYHLIFIAVMCLAITKIDVHAKQARVGKTGEGFDPLYDVLLRVN